MRFSLRLASILPSIALLAAPAAAQAKPTGLLVVAHGADSAWNARVRETVSRVRWTHGPVRVAFLMGSEAGTASWDSATTQLQRAAVGGVVIVPLMVSSWGSHVRQVQFYAGKIAEIPPELVAMEQAGHDHHAQTRLSVPTVVSPALDDAPELGEALISRWNELTTADKGRPLMLIAHGPNSQDDVAYWETNILTTAKALRTAVAPRPVRVALLRDDAPADVRAASIAAMRDTISALARAANDSVTVLPVLISTGAVNRVTIPRDIAGLPVRYAPVGLAPHAALSRWIGRVAEVALRNLPTVATDVDGAELQRAEARLR